MGNIKSVTYIGEHQTYDLEVDHPDHQFYLANGILTSNSHATVYSMVSYHTAYLKANYPVEFLLANLMAEINSNTPDAKINVEKIKKELRQHKIKIVPPDINKSQLTYVIQDNKLITGLDALKFVGDEAIKDIIDKRPFNSFLDFMSRVDSRKVRANNIQALVASGCLDSFKLSRKSMFLYCSDYRKKLQVWSKKHDPSKEEFIYPWVSNDEWSLSELYALEQYYLGEAFVCKPYKAYGRFFEDEHNTVIDLKKAKDKTKIPNLKAIVRDFFEFRVKKENSKYYGQAMVKAVIEDMNGDQCSLTIFPDRWNELQEKLKMIHSKAVFEPGIALNFSGNSNNYEDEKCVILDQVFGISFNPALPADLKSKKVNLKETKLNVEASDPADILQNIEDILYDKGLLDFDDD